MDGRLPGEGMSDFIYIDPDRELDGSAFLKKF